MKLIFNDTELDPTQEHEIFSTNKFGLTAKVQYKKDSWYEGVTQDFNNLTEVHFRYTDLFNPTPCDRVALESDLHGTGGTRELKDIESITISEATELADSW